jgi:hypothetical protein
MKKINEIKNSLVNPLYLIVYVDDWTGEVGLDYTTNLIEFYDLLRYHEDMGSTFEVYKMVNNKKEKLK